MYGGGVGVVEGGSVDVDVVGGRVVVSTIVRCVTRSVVVLGVVVVIVVVVVVVVIGVVVVEAGVVDVVS